MAIKQLYVGSQGPLIYDDSSVAGQSKRQVATMEDVQDSQITEAEQTLLNRLLGLNSAGLVVRKADGTFTIRTLEGTDGEIDILYPDGQMGNPKIGLPSAVTVTELTTSGLKINTTVYNATGNATKRIPIMINGSVYYMLLQQ